MADTPEAVDSCPQVFVTCLQEQDSLKQPQDGKSQGDTCLLAVHHDVDLLLLSRCLPPHRARALMSFSAAAPSNAPMLVVCAKLVVCSCNVLHLLAVAASHAQHPEQAQTPDIAGLLARRQSAFFVITWFSSSQ